MTATATRQAWRLGTAPWLLGSSGATRAAPTAHQEPWVERSQVGPGGEVVRWRERTLDAATGHVERRYISGGLVRYAAALGTAQLAAAGTAPAWTPPRRQAPVASSPETFGAVRVTMTPEAWRSLAKMPLASGVEIGGALLGERRDNEIIVREAIVADADRTRNSVRIDSQRIDGLVSGDLAWRSAELVGHFHSHPAERGLARPSAQDMKSWLSWSRDGDGPFVGVIITRSDQWTGRLADWESWTKPCVTAVVITRDSSGAVDCDVESLTAPPGWTL